MSYLPAFHLTDGPFVRCRDCAAIVYQTDTATHDAWHESVTKIDEMVLFLDAERKGMELSIAKAAKTAGKAVFPK